MSILRRTTSHLDDAAFAELWTNALADGAAQVDHPHLQECAECRLRLTSFSNWMDDLRMDAIRDADDAISGDRLAAQQAQIFRRLEAAERPARVIAFPKHPADASRQSPVRRWIAAAAAAGLIAGVGLGQILDLRHWSAAPAARPAAERVTDPRPLNTAVVPAVASHNDEAALADLEEAATPRYEALRAFDTFTPRAADLLLPR